MAANVTIKLILKYSYLIKLETKVKVCYFKDTNNYKSLDYTMPITP